MRDGVGRIFGCICEHLCGEIKQLGTKVEVSTDTVTCLCLKLI